MCFANLDGDQRDIRETVCALLHECELMGRAVEGWWAATRVDDAGEYFLLPSRGAKARAAQLRGLVEAYGLDDEFILRVCEFSRVTLDTLMDYFAGYQDVHGTKHACNEFLRALADQQDDDATPWWEDKRGDPYVAGKGPRHDLEAMGIRGLPSAAGPARGASTQRGRDGAHGGGAREPSRSRTGITLTPLDYDGEPGVLARYRDRRNGKMCEVHVPYGVGFTPEVIDAMDAGNFFKLSKLSRAVRRFAADIYHTDGDVRDEAKHVQNALNDIEGYGSWEQDGAGDGLREEEVERLRRVAQTGRRITLRPCKHYDSATGRCSGEGRRCNRIHFGPTEP